MYKALTVSARCWSKNVPRCAREPNPVCGCKQSLSLRVFWPPISLPERTRENNHDWEQKYLTAASNVAVAVVLVSRASFTGRFYDVTKYVWSSKPDDLLVEWDLIIELFDRGRIKVVIPCLVGDLMNAKQVKTQGRILAKLGIDSLDEKAIVARVRDLFKFADKDRSGSIDRRELHDCFEKFGLQVRCRISGFCYAAPLSDALKSAGVESGAR
eukprot:3635268-Rhodomonas_salina.1